MAQNTKSITFLLGNIVVWPKGLNVTFEFDLGFQDVSGHFLHECTAKKIELSSHSCSSLQLSQVWNAAGYQTLITDRCEKLPSYIKQICQRHRGIKEQYFLRREEITPPVWWRLMYEFCFYSRTSDPTCSFLSSTWSFVHVLTSFSESLATSFSFGWLSDNAKYFNLN